MLQLKVLPRTKCYGSVGFESVYTGENELFQHDLG